MNQPQCNCHDCTQARAREHNPFFVPCPGLPGLPVTPSPYVGPGITPWRPLDGTWVGCSDYIPRPADYGVPPGAKLCTT